MTNTMNRTKVWIALAATALVALAITVGCYLLLPSGYLSIDLNPSIELRTNRLNHVTSIVGANADGERLLEGYQLRDRDLDDVIEDLVDRMVLQGFLGQDHTAQLLVTADDDKTSRETLVRVNERIESYLEYRSVTAGVLGQAVDVDDDLRDRATEQQVSVGKLAMIDRLVASDPTLHPEDLRDTKVSDLLAYAKEKNIPLALLEDRLDAMEDRFDDDRSESVVDQLEEQLDDYDDVRDNDDDRDDYIDDRDDYDDDRNDYDDDRNDYDDDRNDYDDDRNDYDDDRNDYDDDRNDYDDDRDDYDDDRDDYDDDRDDYDDDRDDYDDDRDDYDDDGDDYDDDGDDD